MPSILESNEQLYAQQVPDNIQCQTCKYKIGLSPFENDYHKAYCRAYPYPTQRKPIEIQLEGKFTCVHYEEE